MGAGQALVDGGCIGGHQCIEFAEAIDNRLAVKTGDQLAGSEKVEKRVSGGAVGLAAEEDAEEDSAEPLDLLDPDGVKPSVPQAGRHHPRQMK